MNQDSKSGKAAEIRTLSWQDVRSCATTNRVSSPDLVRHRHRLLAVNCLRYASDRLRKNRALLDKSTTLFSRL